MGGKWRGGWVRGGVVRGEWCGRGRGDGDEIGECGLCGRKRGQVMMRCRDSEVH